MSDDLAIRKALAALDAMAETWAHEIQLERSIAILTTHDDHETRFIAFAKQSFIEGAYRAYLDAKDGKIPSLMALDEHDRRVAELLEANNREVERRRAAEEIVAELAEWHARSEAADGDDFLNGDAGDKRNGFQEIAALGKRAAALINRHA